MGDIIAASIMIYVLVWLVTLGAYWWYWGFWKAEITFFNSEYGDEKYKTKHTRTIEYHWSDCNKEAFGKCYLSWFFFLVPFLNLYWKYVKYTKMNALLKKILESSEGYYKLRCDYSNVTRIGFFYSNGYYWDNVVPASLEKEAIDEVITTLSDLVYYLPILLLLVVFFIGKFE